MFCELLMTLFHPVKNKKGKTHTFYPPPHTDAISRQKRRKDFMSSSQVKNVLRDMLFNLKSKRGVKANDIFDICTDL